MNMAGKNWVTELIFGVSIMILL
ncbi:UNVERIFIED_CONTAM: hypothetical protein GTU68_063533 [Idotea baltica]|nr:hypothetical protein [Idotea baltica]